MNDLRHILHGAEQAVARGDHANGERLLRQALALQETSVGAQHPDVANTLNNLAIVCEMNGKLDDAEACYRRAYAIAVAKLPTGDPFIATSRDNLEQFCQARGIPLVQAAPPVTTPAAPPGATPRAVSPRPGPPVPRRATSAVPSPPTTVTTTREPHALAVALGIAALVVLIAVGWFLIETDPQPARTVSSPAPTAPVPGPPPSSAAPAPSTTSAASEPVPTAPPPQAVAPPREAGAVTPTPAQAAAIPERPVATTRSSVNVLNAQVCSRLTRGTEWTCTPVGAEQGPGTLYFYTRVTSRTNKVVEHRWYRDGQLRQRVELTIGANPSGFRTYSRTTVTADSAGTWKVELRSEDGEILDTQTFSVR